MNNLCPCGNNQTYYQCCQRLHSGKQQAETAEQLMRSRFCAFYQGAAGVEGMDKYLLATQHPEQQQSEEQQVLQHIFLTQQWLSLKILKSAQGSKEDNKGWVEFVAFSQSTDAPQTPEQLHEISSFVKENNQWFYVDGEIKPAIKLTRNELCWCGSRRKHKHCHG